MEACELKTLDLMPCPSSSIGEQGNSTRKRQDILQNTMLNKNITHEISEPGIDLTNQTEYGHSREEIILRRKLKVAARKQMKKLEKQQIIEKSNPSIIEKPLFSLQLALEEFPSLDALKSKKRVTTSTQQTLINNVAIVGDDKSTRSEDSKSNKTVEKSWKPKIKDPIQIDLSQALLTSTEKHKPVLKSKKVDTGQRNILTGNILDSDNPKRNKGKVRPDKLKCPSKLKKHILNERNERKKLSETKENNSVPSECLHPETTENKNILSCDTVDNTANVLRRTEVEENQVFTDETQSEYSNKVNSSDVASSIHSRRFREYCTNCLSEGLVTSVCDLLEKVAYFQDRMYAREPIKASAKRRYVAGINQVNKYLQVRKVKLLVIAPDLEKNPGKGGLDERVEFFKMEAESQNTPCVFGPNRKRLGKAVKKNTLVSCVAVLSYEGAEEQYTKVLELLNEAKTKYLRLTGVYEETSTEDSQNISLKAADSCDVTSSLLATLRGEIIPADRLLSAIQHSGSSTED